MVPKGTTSKDSIVIVNNFINQWASKQILKEAADNNIGDDEKFSLDKLVEQYKTDLYTNLYLEKIVTQSLDTTVTEAEIKKLYDDTKDYFRLNTHLIKLRFVVMQHDHPKLETIKRKFFSASEKDKKYIESIGFQFKQYALNDDVWVETTSLFNKLHFLTPENVNNYLISGKNIQVKDSSFVYMVKIKQVLDKGEVSPFDFQKETIKDIIINKRKLELIKKFEKEITDNAIKNEKIEIYK